MKREVTCTFLLAGLTLATAVSGMRLSAAADAQVKSGVDRLYVIDCGDGSGQDESRWTPGPTSGSRSVFPDTATSSTTPRGGSCGTRALMML
jgi:N-acyl homoserine lactone hydrolase